MRIFLGEYSLFNRHSNSFEPSNLFQGIAQNNISDFENIWKPAFDKKRAEIENTPEAIEAANIQDAHWKWKEKAEYGADRLDFESYAIETAGATQGLMILDMVFSRSKIEAQKNKELAYVEILATAPWNRLGFTKEPKYKGIGRLMLATAVNASIDAGFKGRIGLHSLPQSLTWYQNVCKMTDFGPDPEKKMHYFEFSEDQAINFIGANE